ncbi:peptidase c26 family protein [Stylonychia lemnae]|uniref:folate gamma-glutamyl hydrolase n=1 Tax=Stylonychia lemnae TaxID=5949 RepID=A0A078AHB4_STYLE|nr:peptidase c26 family protein [Stylonychia lemnae]|eukprot:CDW80233.1 peptidase c26 family protein [Stylonychia lemnae]
MLTYITTLGLILSQTGFATATQLGAQSHAESLNKQTINIPANAPKFVNDAPVIGVVSQYLNQAMRDDDRYNDYSTYMRKAYVNYLSASGARVIPILFNTTSDDRELAKIDKVQGVFFCGGAATRTVYEDFGKKVFEKVKTLNDKGKIVPIWGTCLGFENLAMFVSDTPDTLLENFDSRNDLYNLEFQVDPTSTKMFGSMGSQAYIYEQNPILFNYHIWGISPATFQNDKKLNDFYTVTSTSVDNGGKVFANTIEAKNYPFFGTQFHPEGPLNNNVDYAIDRSLFSIQNNRYFGDFFVNQCRLSNNDRFTWEEYVQLAVENYDLIVSADSSVTDIVFRRV